MDAEESLAQHWESRYAGSGSLWSGEINPTFREAIESLELDDVSPALDLGCGEGADAVWLARRGVRVTGVDLSPTAVARAAGAAERMGVAALAQFVAADLSEWLRDNAAQRFGLVTATFLHSPTAEGGFDRAALIRAAAGSVRDGGFFVSVSHAAAPPWAAGAFPGVTPAEELANLGAGWEVLRAGVVSRSVERDGDEVTLEDGVVIAHRV